MDNNQATLAFPGRLKLSRPRRLPLASATSALLSNDSATADAVTTKITTCKVPLRPASDVVAGALARGASQSVIMPLDTIKVRCLLLHPCVHFALFLQTNQVL